MFTSLINFITIFFNFYLSSNVYINFFILANLVLLDFRFKIGETGLSYMSRYQLSNQVDSLHINQHATLTHTFKSVSYICTTTDIWTSCTRRFLGVTAHWVRTILIYTIINLIYHKLK